MSELEITARGEPKRTTFFDIYNGNRVEFSQLTFIYTSTRPPDFSGALDTYRKSSAVSTSSISRNSAGKGQEKTSGVSHIANKSGHYSDEVFRGRGYDEEMRRVPVTLGKITRLGKQIPYRSESGRIPILFYTPEGALYFQKENIS